MNNKGFTLIELMASIIILSLILLIAVPAINNVAKMINENNRSNNIKNIEIAAAKYAFDTGETIIFVDKLVTEGYIESDKDGNIRDNLNNGRLNCYVVTMEKVSDYYKAKFIDDKAYEINGKCDESKLNELNEDISIEILNNGISTTDNNWLKGEITLRVYSNTVNIDCNNNLCSWNSSSGANQVGKGEINININGLLETKYNFQLTVKNEDGTIKRYGKSVNLKIDNEPPTIYENEINVTNRYEYTSSKDVTISASDGKGSGISGYYIGQNINCYDENIKYQNKNVWSVNSNGNYIICVKDNVGNITTSSALKIDYIM